MLRRALTSARAAPPAALLSRQALLLPGSSVAPPPPRLSARALAGGAESDEEADAPAQAPRTPSGGSGDGLGGASSGGHASSQSSGAYWNPYRLQQREGEGDPAMSSSRRIDSFFNRAPKKARLGGDDADAGAGAGVAAGAAPSAATASAAPMAVTVPAAVPRTATATVAAAPAPARTVAPASKAAGAPVAAPLTREELRTLAARNHDAAAAVDAAATAAGGVPPLSELLVEPSWREALGGELAKPAFKSGLQSFLAAEWAGKKVFPPRDMVFRALNSVPLAQVRLVVIGQDPYHGDGQACGLSFSVPRARARMRAHGHAAALLRGSRRHGHRQAAPRAALALLPPCIALSLALTPPLLELPPPPACCSPLPRPRPHTLPLPAGPAGAQLALQHLQGAAIGPGARAAAPRRPGRVGRAGRAAPQRGADSARTRGSVAQGARLGGLQRRRHPRHLGAPLRRRVPVVGPLRAGA